MKKKLMFAAIAAAFLGMAAVAPAQQAKLSGGVVKIGILTDLSGLYSDLSGQGSLVAARMAIDDFLKQEKNPFKVELVSADHQNKGDVASNKAREWFERDGVDMIGEGRHQRAVVRWDRFVPKAMAKAGAAAQQEMAG